MIGKSLENVRF